MAEMSAQDDLSVLKEGGDRSRRLSSTLPSFPSSGAQQSASFNPIFASLRPVNPWDSPLSSDPGPFDSGLHSMATTRAGQSASFPPPPSSFRSSLFVSPADDVKQQTFRALKPPCTSLLSSSPLTPHSLPQALTALHQINFVLNKLADPSLILTSSLTSYVFFPITQLLQRNPPSSLPPSVREGILKVLTVLVRHWHGDGRIGVREQIWKMMIGWWKSGGLGEREEGVKAWVGCLESVVWLPEEEQSEDEDDGLNEIGTEKSLEEKNGLREELKEFVQRESFLPIIGETLSLLIGICQSSPSPQKPLLVLRYILRNYLLTSPRMLATILPGAVSTMCKIVSPQVSKRGGRGVQGEAVKEALGVLGDVVVGCFRREVVVGIEGSSGAGGSAGGLGSLEELNDWVEGKDGKGWKPQSSTTSKEFDTSPLSTSSPVPPSPTPSSISESTSSRRTTLPLSPLVTLSSSWLHASAAQILPALVSLSHLKRHTNPVARLALADLASTLLLECLGPLEGSIQVLVGFLLTLSVDEFPSVKQRASSGLEAVLQNASNRPIILPIIKSHLTNSFTTLPLLLQTPHQASSQKILDLSLQITAVSLLPSSANLLQGLLGPLGGVQRWGSGLLDCLEFERSGIDGAGDEGRMKSVAELAWRGVESSERAGAGGTESSSIPDRVDTPFPKLQLQNIPDPRTAKAFEDMLVSLGQAGGVDALFSVEHFISITRASSKRAARRGVAAVWCAGKVLEGVTASILLEEGGQEGGKIGPKGKKLRKTVRGLVRSLVELDEESEDEEEELEPSEVQESSSSSEIVNPADSRLPTEYSKGFNAITTLLDKPLPSASSIKKKRDLPGQHKPLLTCLALSLLAQSSSILSTSFRPLLLSTLYYLLSHLGSPHPLVRSFAEVALARVAYHTGYASVQNLVMDNVDYVINVVSQRLTSARLSQAAPLVLISMIRLVGEPIVPLVHDIVDEIFDALDDFHGYETIASTLLAVLDTLMKVMANESSSQEEPQQYPLSSSNSSRRQDQPKPKQDLENFKLWFLHRHEKTASNLEDVLSASLAPEPTPQKAWGAPTPQPGEENLEDENGPSPSSLPPQDGPDAPPKITRSQTVCVQILAKALFFLTHASPFIRARVLSLFTSGISVLGPAKLEGQLLPIINKAWPYVLNRMNTTNSGAGTGGEEPYVVVEAARVLESLAEHVGDFMGSRIRDEGWPKLKKLLLAQVENDRKGALVLRRPGAGGTANPIGARRTKHSTSHRLYLSILSTLFFVARSTNIASSVRWELTVLVRPFLDASVHEELQGRARMVMGALGRVDGDAVWAALSATAEEPREGEEGGEKMGWLREVGWEMEDGVREVLEGLGREE